MDRKVISCNFVEATNVARVGARCYVLRLSGGICNERIAILCRSRGGRWVEKWESMARLGGFRLKTIPSEHRLYARLEGAPTEVESLRSGGLGQQRCRDV